MVDVEDIYEPEWVAWFRQTPEERWKESARLWHHYVAIGGSRPESSKLSSPGTCATSPPSPFSALGGAARRRSASRELIRQTSESLAGRLSFLELTPFLATEVEVSSLGSQMRLWSRGGFPRSYLASDDEASRNWRAWVVAPLHEPYLLRENVTVTPLGHLLNQISRPRTEEVRGHVVTKARDHHEYRESCCGRQ